MDYKFGFICLTFSLSLTACFENPSSAKTERKNAKTKETAVQNGPANPKHLTCAQETCGSAMKLPYVTAPAQPADVALYKQFAEPLFDEYLNLEINSIEIKSKIINMIPKMEINKISDAHFALINFMYVQQYSSSISKSLTVDNQMFRVNTYRLKQELAKSGVVDAQVLNWLILMARTIYESESFYETYYLSNFPLEIFVQKVYPGQDLLTALATEARKLLAVEEKLEQAYPLLKSSSQGTKQILQKMLNKEPLARDEQEDFTSRRVGLLAMNEILPRGAWRALLLQSPLNIKELTAKLILKTRNSPLAQANPSILAQEKQGVVFQCTFNLLGKIASSPTPEQNSIFSSLMQNLKAEAQTVLNQSRYSSPAILQNINKIKIMLPPTKQQTAIALARTLKNKIALTKEMIELVSHFDISNQDDKENALIILASSYLQEKDTKADLLEDVQKFCDENLPEPISDAAFSSYQLINVGWRSVLYPQYGYGILSHEIGHVISESNIKNEAASFQRVRECLKLSKNGAKNTIEEDFADLFATQMMKLNPRAHSNYSCLLLTQKDIEYTDLQMNEPSDNAHSSGFYRLIAIGSQLNSLSPTCEAVKTAVPEGKRMQNCWGL